MPNVDLTISRRAEAALTRTEMINAAKEWKGTPYSFGGNFRTGIDCSHFVYQALNEGRKKASDSRFVPQEVDYRSTSTIEDSGLFFPVATPQSGDLVLWDGHVGIVVDPSHGTFIGAQTSTGVAEANYNRGYWSEKSGRRFLRFVHFF